MTGATVWERMADGRCSRGYFASSVDGLIYAVEDSTAVLWRRKEVRLPERNSWTEVSDLSVAVAAPGRRDHGERRLGRTPRGTTVATGEELVERGPGQSRPSVLAVEEVLQR